MALKTTFADLHDAFHVADSKITSSNNRSMSTSYAPPTEAFMPKKPQTPAQYASVKKAAQASVAKRRGLAPMTARPIKSFTT